MFVFLILQDGDAFEECAAEFTTYGPSSTKSLQSPQLVSGLLLQTAFPDLRSSELQGRDSSDGQGFTDYCPMSVFNRMAVRRSGNIVDRI